jgi:Holliday junction resolvase
VSNYAKGRRREYRVQQILELAGYQTIRAASSKGCVDVVALKRGSIRLVSVKSGSAYASGIERETLRSLASDVGGYMVSVEIWRFPDRCREPLIEVL